MKKSRSRKSPDTVPLTGLTRNQNTFLKIGNKFCEFINSVHVNKTINVAQTTVVLPIKFALYPITQMPPLRISFVNW